MTTKQLAGQPQETFENKHSTNPAHPIEVMYVEDSLGDVFLTKQIFAEFLPSVKLSIARDGAEALAMLDNPEFKPVLIILDLNLPALSGYDVLQRFTRKNIPVVIFSASTNVSDVERTLLLGAREYIQKPMDFQSYRNAVLGMVRNWAMPEEASTGAATS
jgi:DNA-binding response OmpR family regulator